MDLNEGQILAGKYRIEKVLGQGGMGVVIAATHLQLGERVALKFLLPEALSQPEAVERFAREARAAVRIKSEHVARVSDVGTLDNGVPYMVMEYLDGGDLAAWLKQRGALPVEQAVEFVLQACEAIAEAHALGIVHRDLKPANLFVIQRPDGALSVKVLDFGISKSATLGTPGGGMTKTSAVMGSPFYMSPEQMQSSKDTDARADIWALGVVLHELLAGSCPFQGDTMPELVLKIVSAPPIPLAVAAPGVAPGLAQVIRKCLEKDRNQRYPTIGALALALVEFGPSRSRASADRISGIIARAGMSATATSVELSSFRNVVASDGSRAGSPATQTSSSWGQTAAVRRSPARLALVVLAASLAVAGVAGGGYALLRARTAMPGSAASALPGEATAPPRAKATTAAVLPAGSVPAPPVIAEPTLAPSRDESASTVPVVPASRVAAPISPANARRGGQKPLAAATIRPGSPAPLEKSAPPAAAPVNPLKMKLE